MIDSSTEVKENKSRRPNIPFWVTVVRCTLAMFLGLALLIQPDKARPALVNFMGFFWLASGIMSLRWGAVGQPTKQLWPILAGAAGIFAGILAITRRFTAGYISEPMLLNLLGGVMVLIGLGHILGGFRIGKEERHRTWASMLLGVFEVVLGILALLAQSVAFLDTFYWVFTLWALVGGFILFFDALAMRRRAHQG